MVMTQGNIEKETNESNDKSTDERENKPRNKGRKSRISKKN